MRFEHRYRVDSPLGGTAARALAGAHRTGFGGRLYRPATAGIFYHQGYRFDAGATLAAHLQDQPDLLRRFVDVQLLIAAQTTSGSANARTALQRRNKIHPGLEN